MADDVTIRFTADVSDLQRGLQQAAGAVDATTASLRAGASQINASFAGLSQAYVNSAAQKIASAQSASDADLAIARQAEQARYDVALNGVSLRASLLRGEAQTGQISRQQELSGLLDLENRREAIEAQYLRAQQNTYQQGALGYATAQRRIDELASQSALRRQQITREVTQQIDAEYRRSFEQIGSSVTGALTGMIRGHETLRDAARQVALSIVQSFIAARVRLVADWLAGLVARTTATQAAEAAQTGAVAAGVSARAGLVGAGAAASNATMISSVLKNIAASASETFAGIFGFLAPVMGPAAAAPAAAGQAAVLGVAGGLAVGAWELPSDMIVQAHKGEMVVPAGVTPWAQGVLANGGAAAGGGGGAVNVHHATSFSIQAIDAAGVRQFLKNNGKQILRAINEGVRTGSHLGLSKLGRSS